MPMTVRTIASHTTANPTAPEEPDPSTWDMAAAGCLVEPPSETVVADAVERVRETAFAPPTRAERQELTHTLLLAAAFGDPHRRKELLDDVVLINRVVAESLARRYRNRGVALEDLEQAALEGLVKAVERFDPTVRPELLTYAVPTIRGEVQRYFRDHSWTIRPPRRIQELQWRINRSAETLSSTLGREPTAAEVCSDVACTPAEYDEAVRAFGLFQTASLDFRPAGSDGTSLAELVLDARHQDQLGGDGTASAEARAVLGPVVKELKERDRRILYLRFFEDRSQNEIAQELGVTQMQVSRLLARIFHQLRQRLGEPGDSLRAA